MSSLFPISAIPLADDIARTPVFPASVSKRSSAAPVKLALIVALCLIQAACVSSETQERPEPARSHSITLRHSVGEVTSGAVISHVFTLRNPYEESVRVAEDGGIERSCGCVSLAPSVSDIAPNGEATVTLVVDTSKREGDFAQGGAVHWRSPSGLSLTARLVVSGTCITPFTVTPPLLRFASEELTSQASQIVRLQSSIPVDWSDASFSCVPANFQVEAIETTSNFAAVRVTPRAQPSLGDLNCTLQITASANAPMNSAVQLTKLTAEVPILARQSFAFAVAPKVVPVARDSQSGRLAGRCVLTGTAIPRDAEWEQAIECPGYRVTCTTTPVGRPLREERKVFLDFALEPVDTDFETSSPEALTVRLAEGQVHVVPLRYVPRGA